MPPEQSAKMLIVPVGATVVVLQLRRRRSARIRSPRASRAHVSSGPQMLSAHSGNTPRVSASRSDSFFDSSSTNFMSARPTSIAASLL